MPSVRLGVHNPRTVEHSSYSSETGKGDESRQLAKVLDSPPFPRRLKIPRANAHPGSSPGSGTRAPRATRSQTTGHGPLAGRIEWLRAADPVSFVSRSVQSMRYSIGRKWLGNPGLFVSNRW